MHPECLPYTNPFPAFLLAALPGQSHAPAPVPELPANVFDRAGFREIAVSLEPEQRALWCRMQPTGRPSFTPQLLADLSSMQRTLQEQIDWDAHRPFDFLVFSSSVPQVFNLGGDLTLFRRCIESGDRAGLRSYAHQCVEIVHANHIGYDRRVVTISLIQGEALGGGFESALSSDILIAERRSRFGFPEILFNLFPGMGAYSLLSRRIGPAKTEEMLRSGKIYTAEEMHSLGVIDAVVDDGQGEVAVREKMRELQSRLQAQSALFEVRRRVHPVTLQELRDIADLWVDTAFRLDPHDLARMGKIVAAQDRSLSRRVSPAAL